MLKMNLQAFFELKFDIFLAIEVFESSKKPGQIISVIDLFVEFFELWEDFNKISHDIGKDCYSKKQHEGSTNSFNVSSRVEVSKTHSR